MWYYFKINFANFAKIRSKNKYRDTRNPDTNTNTYHSTSLSIFMQIWGQISDSVVCLSLWTISKKKKRNQRNSYSPAKENNRRKQKEFDYEEIWSTILIMDTNDQRGDRWGTIPFRSRLPRPIIRSTDRTVDFRARRTRSARSDDWTESFERILGFRILYFGISACQPLYLLVTGSATN